MTKRLLINSDNLEKSELSSIQRLVFHLLQDQGIEATDEVFDEIVEDASYKDPWEVFEKIKEADEIYALSALIPLIGGSNFGAPLLMDNFMKIAIMNGIMGKKVIFLRTFEDIDFENIDFKNFQTCFAKGHNQFYTISYSEDYKVNLCLVDTSTLEEW